MYRAIFFLPVAAFLVMIWGACRSSPFTPRAGEVQSYTYRQIISEGDTIRLPVLIHYPDDFNPRDPRFAIVFFFGGGWNGGDPTHFLEQARHYAQKGLIAIRADYRTKNRHGTSPVEALKDARSAMRFLKKNARALGIDPKRIIGSGGSAGGHLAAATALTDAYNHPDDDLSIDPSPQALILFNPVIDNGPEGYGYERIGAEYARFSPYHNLGKGSPPTLFLLGTNDRLVPVQTAQSYCEQIREQGGICELKLFEGQEHGFFNYRFRENFRATLEEADAFLRRLGYLE